MLSVECWVLSVECWVLSVEWWVLLIIVYCWVCKVGCWVLSIENLESSVQCQVFSFQSWKLYGEGGYWATWKREFKLPWRKAGLLKSSDSDQKVVNKEVSRSESVGVRIDLLLLAACASSFSAWCRLKEGLGFRVQCLVFLVSCLLSIVYRLWFSWVFSVKGPEETYISHKKHPLPQDHHRSLGTGLL